MTTTLFLVRRYIMSNDDVVAMASARRRLAHLAATVTATAPPPRCDVSRGAGEMGTCTVLRSQRCNATSATTSASAVVVGGLILDVQAWPATGHEVLKGTSVPGKVRQTPGGRAPQPALVIARHIITECVQCTGTTQRHRHCVRDRYWYTMVLWLTLVVSNQLSVAEP